MTDWPINMRTGPIREWPGVLTPASRRKTAPFKTTAEGSYRRTSTPLTATLDLLDRELRMIGGRDVEMLVAISPDQFRLDGQPRAQAKAEHPGVILSLESKHGRLSYPCDTFTTWQDNLRAIALALEALRKVDRYGVTSHGEQYRGFAAIEARPASEFADARAVIEWLSATFVPGFTGSLAELMRRAKQRSHPDVGGDADLFDRVIRAEAYLKQNGAL